MKPSTFSCYERMVGRMRKDVTHLMKFPVTLAWKQLASWLKHAEDLLHKVDKTAKAVSTVSKQQVLAGLRGDQAQGQVPDISHSSYTERATSSEFEEPSLSQSYTNRNVAPTPPLPAADLPPRPPSTRASLGAKYKKPGGGSRPHSARGSAGSLPDVQAAPSKTTAAAPSGPPSQVSSVASEDNDGDLLPVSTTPEAPMAPSSAPTAVKHNGPPPPLSAPTHRVEPEAARAAEVTPGSKSFVETQDPREQESSSSAAAGGVHAPENRNDDSLAQSSSGSQPQSHPASKASSMTDGPSISHSRAESIDGATLSAAEDLAGSGSLTQGTSTAAVPATANAGANASGGSDKEKIARLSRLVQGLKQKIERLQAENLQLEEMLAAADEAHRGGQGELSRLAEALAREQAARVSLEGALNTALGAKETENSSLKQQLEAATLQIGSLSEALAAKEAETAAADAERSMNESQLIATLRKEIENAESILEEERKAHAAARRSSAAREHELDASMAEAAASLSAMQRAVEESTSKAAVAEERCRELEHEVEALGRRAATAEAKVEAAAAAGTAVLGEGSAVAQRVGELEAALMDARRAHSDAESAAATAAEESKRLRADVEILRRQLAEARSIDASDLRKRLQEAPDALYTKQAQLERLTADRAAMQLQLERQQTSAASENLKRRTAAVDRMLGGADDGYGIVPMDSLGETYARLANAPGHIGEAVKTGARFLDSSAFQAVRVLRHYPLGRLAVFCYIVGMHLFIYLLLHRLQRRAFAALAAAEVEHAAGVLEHTTGGIGT